MKALQQILISNEGLDGIDRACQKATLIEHFTGAELNVQQVIWDSLADEPFDEAAKCQLIKSISKAEHKDLESIVARFRDKVASLNTETIWAKDTVATTIEQIEKLGIELLIKPYDEHGLIDYISAPMDWRTVRNAPCATLISKSNDWQTGGNILVAVDATDPDHAELNSELLRWAELLRHVLNAELHIVCTYPDLGQNLNQRQVAFDYLGLKESMATSKQTALDELLAQEQIVARTHVVEGKPAKAISELATELAATVTLIGTHGRSGIGKLILGNTAEAILPKLPGDVLAVKPPQTS